MYSGLGECQNGFTACTFLPPQQKKEKRPAQLQHITVRIQICLKQCVSQRDRTKCDVGAGGMLEQLNSLYATLACCVLCCSPILTMAAGSKMPSFYMPAHLRCAQLFQGEYKIPFARATLDTMQYVMWCHDSVDGAASLAEDIYDSLQTFRQKGVIAYYATMCRSQCRSPPPLAGLRPSMVHSKVGSSRLHAVAEGGKMVDVIACMRILAGLPYRELQANGDLA